MNDTTTTVEQLKNLFATFVKERDWEQFQSPKNLAMNLACEAAELMELFVWCEGSESKAELQKNLTAAQDELADIAFSLLLLCEQNGIDLTTVVHNKMAKNREKYPIQKSFGNRTKYTQL